MGKKQKTNKTIHKRIKITGGKKLLRRKLNQSHFNAKESGHKTRKKRKESQVPPTNQKKIKRFLPNY